MSAVPAWSESKCQARTHLTVRKEEEGRRPPAGGPITLCRSPPGRSALPLRCLCAASALPLRCCGVGARLSGEDWGGGTLRQGTMSSLCSSSPVEKPAVVQRPTRVRVQSTLLPSEQQRLDSYNKHEVQDGDSIQKLAIKYRVSVSPGRRTLIQTTWPSYANCPRVCRPRSRRSRRRTR